MGGKFPLGSEWNFYCDAYEYHSLFREWTRQHGFPLIYINGYDNGSSITAHASTEAAAYAMQLAKFDQRPMWDMLSILFAARGLIYKGTTYFKLGAAGTLPVDPATGANGWTNIDSGHYVLTKAAADKTFSNLLESMASMAVKH
jgi:hypothetical protein